jgi:hypothetical protein
MDHVSEDQTKAALFEEVANATAMQSRDVGSLAG